MECYEIEEDFVDETAPESRGHHQGCRSTLHRMAKEVWDAYHAAEEMAPDAECGELIYCSALKLVTREDLKQIIDRTCKP